MFLLFQEQYSLQLQTLAEAQRTQGIDSVPQIISTAYFHLNFWDNTRYGVNASGNVFFETPLTMVIIELEYISACVSGTSLRGLRSQDLFQRLKPFQNRL